MSTVAIVADNGAMMRNSSVPTDSVVPHLYYEDADAAVDWLTRAFGFVENFRVREPDGRVHTAQLLLGAACVMVRYQRDDQLSPRAAGGTTGSVMVIVDDVDEHFERAVAAEAQIVTGPTDMIYGEREYTVLDLDGHRWTFAQHVADVDPETFTRFPA